MENNKQYQAQRKCYRCLTFLTILYFIGWASSYLMVYKIVHIGNIIETAAIFLFPLSYALSDIITEVYGYAIARQIVWSSLLGGGIFCVALIIINDIPDAGYWKLQNAYNIVFHPILRAYFALLIASLCGSMINIYVISKWKIAMHGRYFWFRSLCSTAIGELVFTIVGSPLCYVGVEPISKMLQLASYGYVFKMLYALIAIIPITIFTNALKEIEGVDFYDYGVNYNPFKII